MPMNMILIKEFVSLENEKAGLEAQLKDVSARRAELKQSILSMFTDANVQNMAVDGRTVYLSRQLWASADEEAHELLKKYDLAWTIKEKVNTQTLSAELRDWEAEGREVPEDLKEVLKILSLIHI